MECTIAKPIHADTGKLTDLYPNQFSFIKGRSCLQNLLSLHKKVSGAVDSGHSVHAAYDDLAKAFDTIPNAGIIEKLYELNVNPYIICWTVNWLSNRSQVVKVAGSLSECKIVTSGMP